MLVDQDFNKTIDEFTYHLNSVIGKGSFSTVYMGKHNVTKERVAIKVINLLNLKPERYAKLQEELLILKSLPPHPNIVQMLSLLQTSNNVYIVTEYCEGSLDKVGETEQNSVCLGIIEGLRHLYRNNVVHRDLKPDNILVKNGVAKIIDFGFAKTLNSQFQILNDHMGTPLYMAPQMYSKSKYTSKCDIWSLGVTLHQVIHKCDPYKAIDIDDLRIKLKTIQPDVVKMSNPTGINKIIKGCLGLEENKRLGWKELFAMADEMRGVKRGHSAMKSQLGSQFSVFNKENMQSQARGQHGNY